MTLRQRLSELLSVREDEVEAVLREDEQRARATVRMQRRGFLGAAAAVAAAPFVPRVFLGGPISREIFVHSGQTLTYVVADPHVAPGKTEGDVLFYNGTIWQWHHGLEWKSDAEIEVLATTVDTGRWVRM